MALAAVVAALVLTAPASAQFGLYWSYPQGIAVSPDNRHVYVGSNDGTLALARDASSGALTEIGWFAGTRGPLEVSPDGAAVYAGTARAGALPLSAFMRDSASGRLRSVPVSGWRSGYGLSDVAVSRDGGTVYATDSTADDLTIFSRNASDGSLSFLASAPHAPGVRELRGMTVSPDGRWLYAAGRASESGAVVRFEILPGGVLAVAQVADCGSCVGETVALSPAGWLYLSGLAALRWDPGTGELGAPGNSPLGSGSSGGEPGGSGLAVAGDGMVYTADTWAHRVFQVRPLVDGYEVVRSYRENQDGARGLQNLRSLAIAPDSRHVYVAAGQNSVTVPGTVATFSRDPASGALTFTSLFTGTMRKPRFEVTINGGAAYTDDRHVLVTTKNGPDMQLELANDGGFAGRRIFDREEDNTYEWTLASTGPDRLPKTVYAREARDSGQGDGGWRGDTVSATIVLDESRPVVLEARRIGLARLRIRARDRISGVRRVQIAKNRRAPGRWRLYQARKLYPAARRAVWVRARDRAGNRSRWRKVRLTHQSTG